MFSAIGASPKLQFFYFFYIFFWLSPPVESGLEVSSDIKWFQPSPDCCCGGSNKKIYLDLSAGQETSCLISGRKNTSPREYKKKPLQGSVCFVELKCIKYIVIEAGNISPLICDACDI
jgi:hypothetical protein